MPVLGRRSGKTAATPVVRLLHFYQGIELATVKLPVSVLVGHREVGTQWMPFGKFGLGDEAVLVRVQQWRGRAGPTPS